jgi:hypothetical protein
LYYFVSPYDNGSPVDISGLDKICRWHRPKYGENTAEWIMRTISSREGCHQLFVAYYNHGDERGLSSAGSGRGTYNAGTIRTFARLGAILYDKSFFMLIACKTGQVAEDMESICEAEGDESHRGRVVFLTSTQRNETLPTCGAFVLSGRDITPIADPFTRSLYKNWLYGSLLEQRLEDVPAVLDKGGRFGKRVAFRSRLFDFNSAGPKGWLFGDFLPRVAPLEPVTGLVPEEPAGGFIDRFRCRNCAVDLRPAALALAVHSIDPRSPEECGSELHNEEVRGKKVQFRRLEEAEIGAVEAILSETAGPVEESGSRFVSHRAVAWKAMKLVPGWTEYNASEEITSVGWCLTDWFVSELGHDRQPLCISANWFEDVALAVRESGVADPEVFAEAQRLLRAAFEDWNATETLVANVGDERVL